jgi:hypothetical protein
MRHYCPPDTIPITRQLVEELSAQVEDVNAELGRLADRAADLRVLRGQLRREIRRSKRRLR